MQMSQSDTDGRRAAERELPRLRNAVDDTAALRSEALCLEEEIAALREAARRKVWEAIVQTREIHGRLCDASARLEHVQLDLRDRTGEARVPAIPMPFADFLDGEIRRFVIAAPGALGR